MAVKLIMLIIFFAVMVGVGLYCRRHSTDVNGFVLGGRSVGPWLTAFAYGTSYFSAVIFIGYAGQFGWKFGIASTWIGLGNAFLGSLLAWVVLGRRTRLMTQRLKSATMPEFFGERYLSKGLKIGASVIVFVFLIPYTASLYNGLSRLFAMAFQWATFASKHGYPCSTIFSTNNLRQFVDACVQVYLNRDADHSPRMRLYGGTLLSFHGGAIAVCVLWRMGFGHWTILGALLPAVLALPWQRQDLRIRQAMGEKLV